MRNGAISVDEDMQPGISQCPIIYFVIPCYNEADCLAHTVSVLMNKMDGLIASSKERIDSMSRIMLVDDGSTDGTWKLIENLHSAYPNAIKGIKLAHNRGHQNALFAGLMAALSHGCSAAISMDADLQDDVNAIDQFIDDFRNGSDIVYGVRSSRKTDTLFKRTTAGLFYKLFNWMDAEAVPNHADYRLMSRRALDALSQYHEENLFLRGLVPTLGFTSSRVYYERGERNAGVSKYPLRKMISFAVEGITSFSTKPLSFVTGAGVTSMLIGIIMLIYVLSSRFGGHVVSGWGSIMCSLWLLGGMIMVSLGIVGEYVGKIYLETKRRPRFYIEEEI